MREIAPARSLNGEIPANASEFAGKPARGRAFLRGIVTITLAMSLGLLGLIISSGPGGSKLSAYQPKKAKTQKKAPVLDAFAYKCIDYHKRPVLNVRNDTLNDVAFSDMMRMRGMNMGPMTIFNNKRLASLSPASQRFFLAHECGHHVLGHLYLRRRGLEAEQEADCYALRSLIRKGQFTLKDIKDVQKDMRKYARASLYHKGGRARADELMNCLE